ncbi:tyrosyl-DNA phosphodiesterase 1 [Cryptosporidium felis]|nr:tyrosyl-DNA phosphodiesterase 1 [Cryptosporidium felis]
MVNGKKHEYFDESIEQKRIKLSNEFVEIISDSSDEFCLGENIRSRKIETPLYLNKLKFEEISPKKLKFGSLFVVDDNFSIIESNWRAKDILIASYVADINWIIHEIIETKVLIHGKFSSFLLITHGCNRFQSKQFSINGVNFTEFIEFFSPLMKVPHGVFHPKFMFIIFEHLNDSKMNFIRIVITSANFILQDWELKSQSIWAQDFFISVKKENSCDFKNYLSEFIKNVLEGSELGSIWISHIKNFDFEDSTVSLIGSIPGYFKDHLSMKMWGHLRVEFLLKNISQQEYNSKVNSNNMECEKLIFQFTSIGRISEKWIYKEFIPSLSSSSKIELQIVFPTVEQIINSKEGLRGGESLPVKKERICKPWVMKLLHRWGSGNLNSTASSDKSVPHIKTFLKYRMDQDSADIIWIIQGSHNLSNAAWGQMQKKGTSFCIRNFELGFLMHRDAFSFEKSNRLAGSLESPKFHWKRVKGDAFKSDNRINKLKIPLPFSIPPRRYEANDCPWNINIFTDLYSTF